MTASISETQWYSAGYRIDGHRAVIKAIGISEYKAAFTAARDSAKEVVDTLHSMGVESVIVTPFVQRVTVKTVEERDKVQDLKPLYWCPDHSVVRTKVQGMASGPTGDLKKMGNQ